MIRMECTVEECPNGATMQVAFPDRGGWALVDTCDDHASRWLDLDKAQVARTYDTLPHPTTSVPLIDPLTDAEAEEAFTWFEEEGPPPPT